jgi:PmbA protein
MAINYIKIKDRVSGIKGDVIVSEVTSQKVKFENDELNAVENSTHTGIGVRVIKNGKVGFTSTNDDSKIDEVFKRAEELSEYGEELDLSLPKNPPALRNIKLYDPSLEKVDEYDMLNLGEMIIKSIKEIDRTITVNLEIEKDFIRKTIINSNGLDVSFEKTIWGFSVEGVYLQNDESLVWLYDSKYTTRYSIDFTDLIAYIRNMYLFSRQNAKISSGKYPVIFSPLAFSMLLEILSVSLSGENVYKGISPLKDKMKTQVFSENFTLIDDPLLEEGISSQPFDDEGILTNYKEVISNGVLNSFLYDLRTAYLMNTIPTGNGFRDYNSLPKPSFSNMVVPNSETPLNSLISRVDKGLIVYNVLGGGQSNVNAGEFSVNVELGSLIESGKIVGRVKNVMLFGNVFELFRNIIDFSRETKVVFDKILPYILCDNVNVVAE